MESQDTRRDRFRALCVEWGVEVEKKEHYRDSSSEDAAPYLHDGDDIGRFVAVTRGDGNEGAIYYLYPHDTFEDASNKTTENVIDDIFPESPVAIYDLDEAKRWDARDVRIEWSGPTAVDAP